MAKKENKKQNRTKTIKQSFFENRRMLFFFECIQNIISDLKAIWFVIFARKVFVSLLELWTLLRVDRLLPQLLRE